MRRWHLRLDSRQREILGLLLLALGVLTLLSLLNVSPGTVSGGRSREVLIRASEDVESSVGRNIGYKVEGVGTRSGSG